MGAGSSTASRDSITRQVIPTQTLVNRIFNWMMNEIEIQDLLKLSNPNECKKYIFFTKRALDKVFDQIEVQPKVGPKNTLYFESIKNLAEFGDQTVARNPKLRELKELRDTNCLYLAYYIVRIFQVFGALSLSVIDAVPETVTYQQDIQAGLPPGIRRPGLFVKRGGGKHVGPADEDKLGGFYTYFKKYFFKGDPVTGSTERAEDIDFYVIITPEQSKQKFPEGKSDTLYYYPESAEDPSGVNNSSSSSNLTYQIRTGSYVSATASVSGDASSLTLTIDNISYVSSGSTIPFEGKTFALPFTNEGRLGLVVKFSNQNIQLPFVLKEILGQMTSKKAIDKTYEEILSKRFGEKREGVREGRESDSYRGSTSGSDRSYDEGGTPVGLAWTKIKDFLKLRPKTYCIARALQLLNPALQTTIRQDIGIKSDVCITDSPFAKEGSVPNYGQKITASIGIRALNTLFYDTLEKSAPAISIVTREKYKEFLKVMDDLYSPELKERRVDIKSLDDIVSKKFPMCSDAEKKVKRDLLIKSQGDLNQIRKAVANLINYQMNHTAKVMNILKQMFVIDSQGQIKGLNPSIERGGMAAVNKMAEQARELLINYYRNCEGIYRLGALELFKTESFKKYSTTI